MNLPNQPKLNYSVIIEQPAPQQWMATVLGWSECRSTGTSKEEAIENLKKMIVDRVSQSEIVQLEIDNPAYKNPWIEFAGMFENDPDFDEVMEHIATYRRELDAQLEAEDRHLESDNSVA